MSELIIQPIVQYGFMGLSAVLLVIIIWLITRLLDVMKANNKIIADNTAAMSRVLDDTDDLLKLHRSLYNKVITRPCIAGAE